MSSCSISAGCSSTSRDLTSSAACCPIHRGERRFVRAGSTRRRFRVSSAATSTRTSLRGASSRSTGSTCRWRISSSNSWNGPAVPIWGRSSCSLQVRQTHRVASLSNSNALHTPIHRRSLEHVVETFYFSDEIGHVKPDREIFDHVVCDLVVPPERIAFFDDTTVNVEAAGAFGLNAYVVDGLDALKDSAPEPRNRHSTIGMKPRF